MPLLIQVSQRRWGFLGFFRTSGMLGIPWRAPCRMAIKEVRVGSTDGEKKELHFHAKESRLWFKSFTPTDWGALVAYIETDIFNLQSTDSERVTNGNTPRLRHAFGSLCNLLAGQTWTTFMAVYTFPELNDLGGPAGQIFGRQAQVRWKQPTGWGSWQVALENPETTLSIPAANGGGEPIPPTTECRM